MGKLRQVVLGGVDIVAGEARHVRGAKAAASLQHLKLVAVHIEGSIGIVRRKVNVLVQRIAGR